MEQLCEEIMGGGLEERAIFGKRSQSATRPIPILSPIVIFCEQEIKSPSVITNTLTSDGMFSHDKQRHDVLRWGRVVMTPALTY